MLSLALHLVLGGIVVAALPSLPSVEPSGGRPSPLTTEIDVGDSSEPRDEIAGSTVTVPEPEATPPLPAPLPAPPPVAPPAAAVPPPAPSPLEEPSPAPPQTSQPAATSPPPTGSSTASAQPTTGASAAGPPVAPAGSGTSAPAPPGGGGHARKAPDLAARFTKELPAFAAVVEGWEAQADGSTHELGITLELSDEGRVARDKRPFDDGQTGPLAESVRRAQQALLGIYSLQGERAGMTVLALDITATVSRDPITTRDQHEISSSFDEGVGTAFFIIKSGRRVDFRITKRRQANH